jgi:hypothetical protein
MTVETATLIHELNSALPDPADGLTEGDNHIRLLKATVKATFPNVNAAITRTDEDINNLRTATAALDALAALTPAADRLPYFTSGSAGALATFSAYARTLLDDADAATARGTLGLGALATLSSVSTANIGDDQVTFAKMQNITTSRLLGRTTASAGNVEEISVGTGLSLAAGVLSATANLQVCHVQDQKASGTAGGASVAAWTTRDLNTTVINTIAGASLSSNQLTLPAGTYVLVGLSPWYAGADKKARIRNVTDSTNVSVSANEATGVSGLGGTSVVIGAVTIASSKAFALQYRVATARATDGLGQAASFAGEVEVYGELLAIKIA